MHKLDLRRAAMVLAASAALTACGSSGGGGTGSGAARTTDIPDSALQSVSGLFAYMTQLIGMTDETSEPILVGDVVLPTDDTAEPSN